MTPLQQAGREYRLACFFTITMRYSIPTAIIVAMTTCVVQAAIPADIDRVFRTYTAIPDTLVPVLEKATSRESADSAAPELRVELITLYKNRAELENIQSLSPAVKAEVLKKYEMDMRRSWGKVYEQIFRLQKVQCYGSVNFYREFQTLCMMLNK